MFREDRHALDVVHRVPPGQPNLRQHQFPGGFRHHRVAVFPITQHPLPVVAADSLGLVGINSRIGKLWPHRLFEHVFLEADRIDNNGACDRVAHLQLVGIGNTVLERIDGADLSFQPRAFATQLLRTLGVVPDFGVFQLALDLDQAFVLAVVVKDTP